MIGRRAIVLYGRMHHWCTAIRSRVQTCAAVLRGDAVIANFQAQYMSIEPHRITIERLALPVRVAHCHIEPRAIFFTGRQERTHP